MTDVVLNEAEQKLAQFLGNARMLKNRAWGVADGKISDLSGEFIDINGIAGELAFCKAANIFPDCSLDGHPDYDCELLGWKIDVKTTDLENGRLLVKPEKRSHPAEVYALVTGKFPGPFTVRGCLPAASVFQEKFLVELRGRLTYAVPQDELVPLGEILEMLVPSRD